MKRRKGFILFLKSIKDYFVFFILIAFVVTCTTMLFVSILSESIGIELNNDNIEAAAKITFLNVILLSALFFFIDLIRRRLTVDNTTKKIAEAAKKLADGDFSVRVDKENEIYIDDNFSEIIDCFNKMASELSGVESLRSDFIANVSHELKTPLSVISNYAGLLSAPSITDSERREYAAVILSCSHKLADMISNILKLSRLENQDIFPDREKYDLSEQLCECLLNYESTWEKKGINIETDIEDGVTVCMDRELLAHVWNNLFSNAMKFTGEGGTVSISLSSDDEYAAVSVKDTGCGMSSEVGKHIFEKFYQGDTSHATDGNGLGLALVKRIVDIIGGDIKVDSEVGVGTEFTVRFKRYEKNI